MAAYNKFNAFVADMANKVHNLGSDTLKVMFTNVAPVATNAVKADITEISAGNGYPAGGLTITGITSSQISGAYALISSGDPAFTATGTVGPYRYAVLYNSTPGAGPLIGWWDRGNSVTLSSADIGTVDLDQVAGILGLT